MDEDTYVKEVYNSIANHFNNTRVNHWSWIDDYVSKLKKNSKILDLGCGNGRNMSYLNYNFTGIDSCKEFIKICEKKGYEVIEADMCELPFVSNSFDNILSIASFHHLSTNDRRICALKEMWRVLKPGGTILLSVWSINQPEKTRRTFNDYGDTIVKWSNLDEKVFERYYYIFEISELIMLFNNAKFKVNKYYWDCGNEIFILEKINI